MSQNPLPRDIVAAVFTQCGIDPAADFHALSSDKLACLERFMRLRRYRAPVCGNGSPLRYWHSYCIRVLGRSA